MRPSFLGLGVEKAATSWIYACLYEHPDLCMPVKEINFFSREENWSKGKEWYENIYANQCRSSGAHVGEFSTEYLFIEKTADRIASTYPDVKLIISLRDPITRAYSQYYNSIKSGEIKKSVSFSQAIEIDKTILGQGYYKKQVENYLRYFPKKNMHFLLYEDIAIEPLVCIQSLYRYLDVDSSFVPSNLNEIINPARVPRNQSLESSLDRISENLQKSRLGNSIWWAVKNSRIPKYLRKLNTIEGKFQLEEGIYTSLSSNFAEDKQYVENLLNRKLNWVFEKEI